MAALSDEQRAPLAALCAAVHEFAPRAWECMSNGIPAFRIGPARKSRVLCGYAAMKAHLGLYFFDGDLVAEFAEDLTGFSTDTGTIRFMDLHPVPRPLLERMLTLRLEQLGAA